ncbi:unnamed protein product [Hymenolepis diminuta]|uniref:Uncharacterized protein n=1 Tax=Hymenolepis diminuta TaxID=6216 RepID=A0A564YXL0_HYMDI|nr:unnamed protein product [Hymenolepis diminuta]
MRILFLIPLSFLLILLSSGFSKPVSLQNDIEEYALTRSKRHLDDNDIEEAKAQLYSQVDAIFDHLIECTASEIPLDECRTVAIRQGDRSYRDRDDDNTAMTMQSRYPDRDGGSPDPYGGHGNANRDNDRYNSKDERSGGSYPDNYGRPGFESSGGNSGSYYDSKRDDEDCEDFYKNSDESGNDDDHDSECDGPECSGLGRSGDSYPDNYGRPGFESSGGNSGSYYDSKRDDEDCEDFYKNSDESGNDDDRDSECDGPECSGLGRSGGSYLDNYGRSGSEGFEGRGGSYPRNNGGSTYGGFGGNGDSYHDNKPGDEDCEDFYKSSDESGNDDGHDSECDGPECSGLGRSGGSYPDNYGRSRSEGFEGSGGSYPRSNGDSAYGGFGGNGDSYYDNKGGSEGCYNGSDCVNDNEEKTDGESGSYSRTDDSQAGVGESGFYPSVEDSKDKNDGSAFYPGTGESESGSDIGYREGEIPVQVSNRREIDCLCTDHKCRCKDSGYTA